MKLKQLITEGVLTEDQVNLLEESFANKLEEKQLEFEKEANEHLAEQFKTANGHLNEQKLLVEEKESAIKLLESKLEDTQTIISEEVMKLEKSTIERLDLYLEGVADEHMSSEITEKLAKLEMYESVFSDMKSLLGKSIVQLDESTLAIIEETRTEADAQVSATENIVSEKDAEIKVLKENLEEQSRIALSKMHESETLKKGLLILRESDGLTNEESDKMSEFFEGKSLEETKGQVSGFKKLLTENSVNTMRTSFKKDAIASISEKKSVAPTTSTEEQLDESRSIESVVRQVEKRPRKVRGTNEINQAESLLD